MFFFLSVFPIPFWQGPESCFVSPGSRNFPKGAQCWGGLDLSFELFFKRTWYHPQPCSLCLMLLAGRRQGWNSSKGEMPWHCWARDGISWLVCWIHRISLSCKLWSRSSRANLEVHLNICVYFSPSNDAKLTLSQFWHKDKELNLEKQLAGGCSVAAQDAEEGWRGPDSHFGTAVSFWCDITWFQINGSNLCASNTD